MFIFTHIFVDAWRDTLISYMHLFYVNPCCQRLLLLAIRHTWVGRFTISEEEDILFVTYARWTVIFVLYVWPILLWGAVSSCCVAPADQIQIFIQIRDTDWIISRWYMFLIVGETGSPAGNPRRYGVNMQTLHRQALPKQELNLVRDGANHYITVLLVAWWWGSNFSLRHVHLVKLCVDVHVQGGVAEWRNYIEVNLLNKLITFADKRVIHTMTLIHWTETTGNL